MGREERGVNQEAWRGDWDVMTKEAFCHVLTTTETGVSYTQAGSTVTGPDLAGLAQSECG